MRRTTLLLNACMLTTACARARERRDAASATTLAPGNHTVTIQHGGRTRSYLVHVPTGARGRDDLPVMLAFHGGGGDAAGFQGYAGLDVVADREGFIVAYPNGSGVLPRRLLTWNAGECCGYAMNNNVDDVAFAIAVLDDLARRIGVDTRRVYATGHSNGAMMAYRLAAERSDRIAAIIPVAGAYAMERFAPSRPVAILHIHSVDDPRALYNGGTGPPFPGTQVRSSHRPVMEGIERWVAFNGCNRTPTIVETRTGQTGTINAGQTATLLRWEGCTAPVAHWRLTGVGHAWPGHTAIGNREEIIGPPTTLINVGEAVTAGNRQ